MSLAAVWFAYLVRQDAARRQLIVDILNVGGTVKFDESTSVSLFRSQSVSEVAIPNDRIADVGPLRLRSFRNLSTLKIGIEISGNNGATMTPAEVQYTEISEDLLEQLESQRANEERR